MARGFRLAANWQRMKIGWAVVWEHEDTDFVKSGGGGQAKTPNVVGRLRGAKLQRDGGSCGIRRQIRKRRVGWGVRAVWM